LVRADSGFWNKKITAGLKAKGCLYSIGVRLTKPVAAAIEQLEESAWRPVLDYPDTGEAQIAETTLADERLIVRRVRTLDDQQQLFASWRHPPPRSPPPAIRNGGSRLSCRLLKPHMSGTHVRA
jgi:hypothetical protein